MEKVHYTDDHMEVLGDQGLHVQLFEEGTLTKSASAGIDRQTIADNMPDKDHFMIHAIAMGSDEVYGTNRNHDGWPRQALIDYHDTFVKNGCFFREHRNRCQETQGIGMIKHAAWNDEMDRVELLIHGHKDKAAEEYELAKSGSELSFSMSSRMPYDTCSVCGNQAKNLGLYCDHLKNQMGQYIPEMKKYAYAINDTDLKFYDISRVGMPADRIAHYLEYAFGDDTAGMRKAASAGLVIPGAAWAAYEQVSLGDDDLEWTDKERKVLDHLTELEGAYGQFIKGATVSEMQRQRFLHTAPAAMMQAELTEDELQLLGQSSIPHSLHKLASNNVVLPFRDFAALTTGITKAEFDADEELHKAACGIVPSIFSAIAGGCKCGKGLADMTSPKSGYMKSEDQVDRMMESIIDRMGMEVANVKPRAVNVTIIKKANTAFINPDISYTTNDYATTLAHAYGVYVVKSACVMGADVDIRGNNDLIGELLIAQNKIIKN